MIFCPQVTSGPCLSLVRGTEEGKMSQQIRVQGITSISLLSCMLAVTILRQPAAAQSIFGAIVGTVTDATGAVIPGAKITATNIRTNEKREFTTNEFGTYELNNLFPGTYVIEGERAGFVKHRHENIELADNQNIRADFTLKVT